MTARSQQRQNFLADVLTTALQGGINYWAGVGSAATRNTESHGFENLTATILDLAEVEGGQHDAVQHIDYNTITRGLRLARRIGPERPHLALADRTNGREGDFDAEDADIVVQLGLFEHIVYG